jgi:transcriptional regulator with XRE-family HTH domain
MGTRNVDETQDPSLIEINEDFPSTGEVHKVGERIRARINVLGISQADAARRSGLSSQRFGNYAQGTRTPDLDTLMRIARALGTTTDWLLGFSVGEPPDVAIVVCRLLELEGLPTERAVAIAETVQEALRVLASLPDEGDAQTRSRIAAQAAWQLRAGSKPTR